MARHEMPFRHFTAEISKSSIEKPHNIQSELSIELFKLISNVLKI